MNKKANYKRVNDFPKIIQVVWMESKCGPTEFDYKI